MNVTKKNLQRFSISILPNFFRIFVRFFVIHRLVGRYSSTVQKLRGGEIKWWDKRDWILRMKKYLV